MVLLRIITHQHLDFSGLKVCGLIIFFFFIILGYEELWLIIDWKENGEKGEPINSRLQEQML